MLGKWLEKRNERGVCEGQKVALANAFAGTVDRIKILDGGCLSTATLTTSSRRPGCYARTSEGTDQGGSCGRRARKPKRSAHSQEHGGGATAPRRRASALCSALLPQSQVTAKEPVCVPKASQAPLPAVGRQETIAW
jgi:hypothetical protein